MTRLQSMAALGLLVACGGLSGCATIVNGTTQSVSVTSDPPGASVTAGAEGVGVTPLTVELERKKNHVVTVSMPGYHTEQIAVNRVLSGAVAGNIIAGGFIGWGVDAVSGGQYKLKPDTLSVKLRPLGAGERDRGGGGLTLEERLRQLDNLRRDGVLSQEEFESVKKDLLGR